MNGQRSFTRSVAVTAGSTATTEALEWWPQKLRGYMSLQLIITGDGTLQVDYQSSNDGQNFGVPEGVSALATGLTKTSGPGGDGIVILAIHPIASSYIRFLFTETGSSDDLALTVYPFMK
ncbi:MAG: hypothetical protein PHQ43_02430 [Dehalococcoidales bacterium]|nr:hypothetical protein [Dehalococcoidales bacterium]